MMIGNKTKRSKNSTNSRMKSLFPKTLFRHIKGIPPSATWGNRFNAIVHDKNLIYIANSNIVYIDLIKKEFVQIFTSNLLSQKERPSMIVEIDSKNILIVTELGRCLIFGYKDNLYMEDINFSKRNLYIGEKGSKFKCGVYMKEKNIMTVSYMINDKENICEFITVKKDSKNEILFGSVMCIPYGDKCIMDMVSINRDTIAIGVSNGIVDIFNFDVTIAKIISINSGDTCKMLFNIDYSVKYSKIASIDNNGTLCVFDIDINNKNYSKGKTLKNKFNDKSIKESYLFFSLRFYNDKIIISSNSGRLFIYDFNSENDTIIELAENPHKSSIYNMLFYNDINDRVVFISSDHSFSVYNISNLNFLFDIKTMHRSPKAIDANDMIVVFDKEDCVLLMKYVKKNNNGVYCKTREIKCDEDCEVVSMQKIKEDVYGILLKKEIIVFEYDNDNVIFRKRIDEGKSFCVVDDKVYIGVDNGKVRIIDMNENKENVIQIADSIISNIEHYIYSVDGITMISVIQKKNSINYILFNQIASFDLFQFCNIEDNSNIVYDTLIITNDNNFLIQSYIGLNSSLVTISISLSNDIINSMKALYTNYSIYTVKRESIMNLLKETKPIITTYSDIFITKINNISLNKDGSKMLVSTIEGIINVYDTTKEDLILEYMIKAHFGLVTSIAFLDEEELSFISTSNDQTMKIWNCNEGIKIDIHFPISSKPLISNDNIEIINIYTKIQGLVLFQQTSVKSKEFIEYFNNFVSSLNEDTIKQQIIKEDYNVSDPFLLEALLYYYFKDEELNRMSCLVINTYEYKNNNKYKDALCSVIKEIKEEKVKEQSIDELLKKKCYIEALMQCKLYNKGKDEFIRCLEYIKKDIYHKLMFHIAKLNYIISICKKQ